MPAYSGWWKRLSPVRLILLVLLVYLSDVIATIAAEAVRPLFSGPSPDEFAFRWLFKQVFLTWGFLIIWWPLLADRRRATLVQICGLLHLGLVVLTFSGVITFSFFLQGTGWREFWRRLGGASGAAFVVFATWYGTIRSGDAEADVAIRCPQCGYDVRGQTQCRCPECGATFTLGEIAEVTE